MSSKSSSVLSLFCPPFSSLYLTDLFESICNFFFYFLTRWKQNKSWQTSDSGIHSCQVLNRNSNFSQLLTYLRKLYSSLSDISKVDSVIQNFTKRSVYLCKRVADRFGDVHLNSVRILHSIVFSTREIPAAHTDNHIREHNWLKMMTKHQWEWENQPNQTNLQLTHHTPP